MFLLAILKKLTHSAMCILLRIKFYLFANKKEPPNGELKTSDVYDAWLLQQVAEVNDDVARLIKMADRSFDPNTRTWLLEFASEGLAEAIANQANVGFYLEQKGIKLAVKATRSKSTLVVLTAMNKKQVKRSTGVSSDDAKRIVDQSSHCAGICVFSDVRKEQPVLYVNENTPKFTGVPIDQIMSDPAFHLFLASAESTASLKELEQKLREDGEVKDFPLISCRTNGDYGEYRVNAWYVPSYSGLECRVTEYLSFTPMPMPSPDQIIR